MPITRQFTSRSLRVSSDTAGRLKKYTTNRSRSVATPSVSAKPRTEEIAVTYKTAAAIAVTRSAATIVRNDRLNAGATAARGERPAWTSSFSRSKNTM